MQDALVYALRQDVVLVSWRVFHLIMTISWLIGGTVVTLLWLRESVTWIAFMSVYAIVTGHWSAYQGSRAEENGS